MLFVLCTSHSLYVGTKEYEAAQRTQIQRGQLVLGQGQFETIGQQQI